MKSAGPLAFSLVMMLVGTVCLAWPSRIQQYAIKSASVAKYNPFLKWMKKPAYIVSLRLCGAVALAVAFFVLWVLFRGGTS